MLGMISLNSAGLAQQRDTLTKNERHRVLLSKAKVVTEHKDMCKDSTKLLKLIKIKEDENK